MASARTRRGRVARACRFGGLRIWRHLRRIGADGVAGASRWRRSSTQHGQRPRLGLRGAGRVRELARASSARCCSPSSTRCSCACRSRPVGPVGISVPYQVLSDAALHPVHPSPWSMARRAAYSLALMEPLSEGLTVGLAPRRRGVAGVALAGIRAWRTEALTDGGLPGTGLCVTYCATNRLGTGLFHRFCGPNPGLGSTQFTSRRIGEHPMKICPFTCAAALRAEGTSGPKLASVSTAGVAARSGNGNLRGQIDAAAVRAVAPASRSSASRAGALVETSDLQRSGGLPDRPASGAGPGGTSTVTVSALGYVAGSYAAAYRSGLWPAARSAWLSDSSVVLLIASNAGFCGHAAGKRSSGHRSWRFWKWWRAFPHQGAVARGCLHICWWRGPFLPANRALSLDHTHSVAVPPPAALFLQELPVTLLAGQRFGAWLVLHCGRRRQPPG